MSIPLDKVLLCMLDIARSCVGSLVCQPGDQYEGEDGRSRSKSVLLCCKRFQGPVKNINRMHYCQSLFILPHPTQCTFHISICSGKRMCSLFVSKNREITYLFGLLHKKYSLSKFI